jgi:hypothetical protein
MITAQAQEMLDRERGRIRGKVSYMSPEQARAEEVDHRSDIFSLGIVLFELCAGRRLFRAADTRETLRRVRAAVVPKLVEVAPSLPKGLSPIVERALASDREDRYQNAGEVHADLSALIFSLRRKVEQADLGRFVARLVPGPHGQDPNKLAVDLLIRALDDATRVVSQELTYQAESETPQACTEMKTAAEIPAARLPEQEIRQITLLVNRPVRSDDRSLVEKVIEQAGGHLAVSSGAEVTALFGYPKALENATGRAVRTAFEVRRQLADTLSEDDLLLPSAAVIQSMVSLDRSVTLVPAIQDLLPLAREMLDVAAPGEVVVTTDAARKLETSYQLRRASLEGTWAVTGPRRRVERLALVAAGGGSIVGRDSELQRALKLLSSVCEGGGASPPDRWGAWGGKDTNPP